MAARMLKIKAKPDFDRLLKVLRREGEPDRVPVYEHYSNLEAEVLELLGKDPGPKQQGPIGTHPEVRDALMRRHVDYMQTLGYDYINCMPVGLTFPEKGRPVADTTEGERAYLQAGTASITSREDFESYPWPDVAKLDYSPFDHAASMLPDGMKILSHAPGGVLEHVMWLLGYERASLLLYDDEELLRRMFDAVGSRLAGYFGTVAQHDAVGTCVMGDDMGFKTGTFLAPDVLRKYLFPWHRKIVEAIHAAGKPAVLHACGNVEEVMDDIIGCGWDAKHSFEDVIVPVWESKKRYGKRISHMGGFDMDRLCRATPDEVRSHARTLIESCAPGGGWAMGTGNSVAEYVPIENFLAMMETTHEAGVY